MWARRGCCPALWLSYAEPPGPWACIRPQGPRWSETRGLLGSCGVSRGRWCRDGEEGDGGADGPRTVAFPWSPADYRESEGTDSCRMEGLSRLPRHSPCPNPRRLLRPLPARGCPASGWREILDRTIYDLIELKKKTLFKFVPQIRSI